MVYYLPIKFVIVRYTFLIVYQTVHFIPLLHHHNPNQSRRRWIHLTNSPMIFLRSLQSHSPSLFPQKTLTPIQTQRQFQIQSKTLAQLTFFPSRSPRNEDEAGLIGFRRRFSYLQFPTAFSTVITTVLLLFPVLFQLIPPETI